MGHISQEEIKRNFANNIRDFMAKSKTTQSDLAKYLDVYPQTISKFVTGENLPAAANAYLIAEYFGVTVDELYGIKSTDIYTKDERKIIEIFRNDPELFSNIKKIVALDECPTIKEIKYLNEAKKSPEQKKALEKMVDTNFYLSGDEIDIIEKLRKNPDLLSVVKKYS